MRLIIVLLATSLSASTSLAQIDDQSIARLAKMRAEMEDILGDYAAKQADRKAAEDRVANEGFYRAESEEFAVSAAELKNAEEEVERLEFLNRAQAKHLAETKAKLAKAKGKVSTPPPTPTIKLQIPQNICVDGDCGIRIDNNPGTLGGLYVAGGRRNSDGSITTHINGVRVSGSSTTTSQVVAPSIRTTPIRRGYWTTRTYCTRNGCVTRRVWVAR